MEFDAYNEAVQSIQDCGKGGLKGEARVVSSGNGEAIVEVETVEDVLRVRVTTAGWVILTRGVKDTTSTSSDDKAEPYYETLHSLLVHQSPAYKQSFGSSLMEQLLALQRQGL